MCKNISNSKILKFDNFLSESADLLLLEGNLMASDKFLSKLSSINDNPIASTLLTAFSNKKFIDKSLTQNWVDVTEKEDIVTFMPDRGATKYDDDASSIFSATSRNEIKIGRLARTILAELGKNVSEKEMEEFVNIYKSSNSDKSKKFELVSGPSIKKYYLNDNYVISNGSLGGSCMKHSSCQRYFKIYTKNPESCQLLVYLNEDGKVLGRALVWKINSKELYDTNQNLFNCDATYFMDRVYTAKDSDIIKFVNYAKDKKWLYKYKMTSDDRLGLVFKYNDTNLFGRIIVKLQRLHFNMYPFVDTLSYTDGDSLISNVGFTLDESDEDAEEGFIMGDTDGDKSVCDSCSGTGYDNDNSSDCKACNGNGENDCPDCKGTSNIICKKCDNGNIKCLTCDGDGEYSCPDCHSGYVSCDDCNGDGELVCSKCDGDGSIGTFDECNGEGKFKCDECDNNPITCTICHGDGKITRKWGVGTRRVSCPGCDGNPNLKQGYVGKEGSKCKKCADVVGRTIWVNRGYIKCKKCDGGGDIPCTDCSYGMVQCKKCDGNGGTRCRKCTHGFINCTDCVGKGYTGKCPDCKGTGILGDCTSCDDGSIKCEICNGTGDKPDEEKKDLCPDCSGLLDELKLDIKQNKFSIK